VGAHQVAKKQETIMLLLRRGFVAIAFVMAVTAWPARTQDNKPVRAPLVTRGRIQLNLAGAEMIVAAAKRKAAAMEVKVNIAVVDDGGHLLAFARMDGARSASAYTAQTKAVTAATYRQETGTLPPKGEPDVLLNLSLQIAAAASGGKLTTLKGGVPVIIEGQVVGAVGVGGGSGDQDAEVARAAVQALVDEIRDAKSE
jgi:glc operon protein GlcG